MTKGSVLLLLVFVLQVSTIAQPGLSTLDSIPVAARNVTYPNLDGIVIAKHGKIA